MNDNFFYSVDLKRIELITRQALEGDKKSGDESLALEWINKFVNQRLASMENIDILPAQNVRVLRRT